MTAKDVQEFYNSTFFDNEKPRAVQLVVQFETTDGQSIRLPGISFGPGATVEEIFRSFYQYLRDNGPMFDPPADKNEPEEKIQDVEPVEHRGNNYLVERYPNNKYIVRKDTGEVMPASPIVNVIIKKYKEKAGL